jgi:hypothetical protein
LSGFSRVLKYREKIPKAGGIRSTLDRFEIERTKYNQHQSSAVRVLPLQGEVSPIPTPTLPLKGREFLIRVLSSWPR